jgi:protein-tyrosine phosphatase
MKIIIDNVLATHGLEDLGWEYGDNIFSKRYNLRSYCGWRVVDCRNDLKDESGNPLEVYEQLISKGCDFITMYGKVLIGCTVGISRSNAIAAGILMKKFGYSYQDALDLVHEKVKIDLIERAHLNALKKLVVNKF